MLNQAGGAYLKCFNETNRKLVKDKTTMYDALKKIKAEININKVLMKYIYMCVAMPFFRKLLLQGEKNLMLRARSMTHLATNTRFVLINRWLCVMNAFRNWAIPSIQPHTSRLLMMWKRQGS